MSGLGRDRQNPLTDHELDAVLATADHEVLDYIRCIADPETVLSAIIDGGAIAPANAASEAPSSRDVAAIRRRPLVFEEDDDLDVPDFLK